MQKLVAAFLLFCWLSTVPGAKAQEADGLGALNAKIVELYNRGNFIEALAVARRYAEAIKARDGDGDPEYAAALHNVGVLSEAQGLYAEAEAAHKEALAIWERTLGPEHANVASAIDGLAALYSSAGRYEEAEPLFKRALAIRQKVLGPDHADVGNTLHNLASLYVRSGRYGEVEQLSKRALSILERAKGPDDPLIATLIQPLATAYLEQARFAEAERLYRRSLSIQEGTVGPDHIDVAMSLNNLAASLQRQGRYAEAEPMRVRVIGIAERSVGRDHPDFAEALNGLAQLYAEEKRYDEAEPLYDHALAIDERVLGSSHPSVATTLNNLGALHFEQGHWAKAVDYWRRSTEVTVRRHEQGGSFEREAGDEVQRQAHRFQWLVKAMWRASGTSPGAADDLAHSSFVSAQRARSSEAAFSLGQMSIRLAKGDNALAQVIRERQGLVSEWQAKDKQLTAARSSTPDRRDPAAETALANRLEAIDTRLAAIDARLATDFPDYAALADQKPISIEVVQGALRDNEALVLFLDTPEWKPAPDETFVWIVTKTGARWLRTELGTKALQERVAALRCGLDTSSWSGDGDARCAALLGLDPGRPRPRTLPFDVTLAHELYKGLLGEAGETIAGKDLLVVPSGALTSLPLQVLITAPATADQLASAAWLIRDHALSVLPSVASLTALRRTARSSTAPEPFIAFADPVLTRDCGAPLIPKACPRSASNDADAESAFTRSVGETDTAGTFFRAGLADVASVKTRLCPLPDTAFEVACVAESVGADTAALVLGKEMTEANVKRMPLDRFRVVHFATHGLLAGETAELAKERAEPALVFSPPDVPTEEDDGLLTASEVAGLGLDADWVVMSACNTAAGSMPGAETLSGLAKAFFYAGARTLLVSHWAVNSTAATLLTSRTFAELDADPALGRARAFQRSMLALLDDAGRPWAAHPSAWAPFVLVGEGGAGK